RRRNLWVLGDRQREQGDAPAQNDDDRQHRGKDRPVNEKAGKHGYCPSARGVPAPTADGAAVARSWDAPLLAVTLDEGGVNAGGWLAGRRRTARPNRAGSQNSPRVTRPSVRRATSPSRRVRADENSGVSTNPSMT